MAIEPLVSVPNDVELTRVYSRTRGMLLAVRVHSAIKAVVKSLQNMVPHLYSGN